MNSHKSQEIDFRTDINGLRAISVALVILFHFKVPGIEGGFVGVDAFFVISGFLMTSILEGQASRWRSISCGSFWAARTTRIVPALLGLITSLLIFGYFWIEPAAYKDLAQASFAASLFISDWVFALGKGYFNPSSEDNWLLHTWSLSVEWQFYIAYPIVYATLHRHPAVWKKRTEILAVGALLSLLLNVILVQFGARWATFAFYLMLPRAWEMLLGGLVFKLQDYCADEISPRVAASLEFVGLSLLFGSAALLSASSVWPSYSALAPTFGTAAVILANRRSRSLLRGPPLQNLGNLSYSIYLWHWPVAVAGRYFEISPLPIHIGFGLGVTLALAFLSANLIERPARRWIRAKKGPNLRVYVLAGMSACTATIAAIIFAAGGIPSRGTGDTIAMNDAIAASKEWEFPPNCQGFSKEDVYGCFTLPGKQVDGIVFGDSHAQMLYPLVLEKRGDQNFDFVTSYGCPPMPGVERRDPQFSCSTFHEAAASHIRRSPAKKVLYASIWAPYFDFTNQSSATVVCVLGTQGCQPIKSVEDVDAAFMRFYEEIKALIAAGKSVYILLPIPAPHKDIPLQVRRNLFEGRRDLPIVRLDQRPIEEQLTRAALLRAQDYGAHVIDPRDFMCANNICPILSESGHSLYKDGNHLRPGAIKRLPRLLNGFLTD